MIQNAEKEVLGCLLYFGLLDQLDIANCASVSGILSKGLYICSAQFVVLVTRVVPLLLLCFSVLFSDVEVVPLGRYSSQCQLILRPGFLFLVGWSNRFSGEPRTGFFSFFA